MALTNLSRRRFLAFVCDTESERPSIEYPDSILWVRESNKLYWSENGTDNEIGGGGGSTPTGTGFRHVTDGVEDSAAATPNEAAATLSLNNPTHASTNDPSADEKSALAGTSGTPGAANKYVTNSDPRNADARTPVAHGHIESDVTNLVSDLASKATPADIATAISDHAGAADPHAGYQKEGEKGSASGYAGLGANTIVPTAQLGTGSASGTTYLRGDQTWATPVGGGGGLGYVLNVVAANLATVADATTYYFGALAGLAPQTVAVRAPLYIPMAGTIKAAYITWRAATAGTSQGVSVYVRLNNSADTLIETIGDTAAVKIFNNAALNISVAQGDYIEIKIVCPTWTTNPATLALGGVIYIE